MCAPVAFVAVSAIASAYAQYRAGKAQEAINEYNADVAVAAAKDATTRGKADADLHRMRVSRFMGTQRATVGASGAVVDTGSPLRIVEDTAAMGELDALTIKVNASRQSWGYYREAEGFERRASAASSAGMLGAGTTLLGGAGQAYGVYRQGR